jgi:hypothetical protein
MKKKESRGEKSRFDFQKKHFITFFQHDARYIGLCIVNCLENKSSTLGLLVTTQFKVLTTLDGELHLVLTG